MSTSLKVVSMAAVFCASLRRRAMVWRSRVMRTRSSRAASSGGDGARACTAAAGAATGVGCAAARSIAASMSPLVTRPSLPVPGTVGGVDAGLGGDLAHRRRQRHVGRLRLGGPAGARRLPRLRSARAGVDRPWSFRSSARAGRPATAPAPSLIAPSSAPTATVSPSLAAMSASTPAAGAGTSIVTLSVSSSTSGSSTATASPAFLNHLPMVASVTDSPSVGTRISAMAPVPRRHGERVDGRYALRATWIAGKADVELPKRLFEELLELRQVLRHQPDRGRGRGRPAGIARAPVLGADLVEHPFEEDIDEHPARPCCAALPGTRRSRPS